MTSRHSVIPWLWKVPLCGVVYAFGTMLGGVLVSALELEMPRVPGGTDPAVQAMLMVPGGIAFALGLAALASGLVGRWWERWAVLATFVFVINGVGNAIEASIFTTLGGPVAGAVVNLPGSVLSALAVALLIPAPAAGSLAARSGEFLARWRAPVLAGRLGLAILAFPVVYFLFGMIVAPIVTPHYAALEFLVLPAMPTMLAVLLLRSTLLLLVSLPIIMGWEWSRGSLVLALGLGHFTAVGLGGLIQAPFFPAVLRWTHGIEILADSMVYAWILVTLLWPKEREADDVAPKSAGREAPLAANR